MARYGIITALAMALVNAGSITDYDEAVRQVKRKDKGRGRNRAHSTSKATKGKRHASLRSRSRRHNKKARRHA